MSSVELLDKFKMEYSDSEVITESLSRLYRILSIDYPNLKKEFTMGNNPSGSLAIKIFPNKLEGYVYQIEMSRIPKSVQVTEIYKDKLLDGIKQFNSIFDNGNNITATIKNKLNYLNNKTVKSIKKNLDTRLMAN